jgi:hypothetical protein
MALTQDEVSVVGLFNFYRYKLHLCFILALFWPNDQNRILRMLDDLFRDAAYSHRSRTAQRHSIFGYMSSRRVPQSVNSLV